MPRRGSRRPRDNLSLAANGATSEFYSNVSTEPKTFGHWLGYDRIDYFETVVRVPVVPALHRIAARRDGAVTHHFITSRAQRGAV